MSLSNEIIIMKGFAQIIAILIKYNDESTLSIYMRFFKYQTWHCQGCYKYTAINTSTHPWAYQCSTRLCQWPNLWDIFFQQTPPILQHACMRYTYIIIYQVQYDMYLYISTQFVMAYLQYFSTLILLLIPFTLLLLQYRTDRIQTWCVYTYPRTQQGNMHNFWCSHVQVGRLGF